MRGKSGTLEMFIFGFILQEKGKKERRMTKTLLYICNDKKKYISMRVYCAIKVESSSSNPYKELAGKYFRLFT